MKKKTFASKKLNMMIMGGLAAEFSVFLQMATDNIIAGHILGTIGLQALTLLTPFITINAFASNLLSFGAELLYSKSVGNESEERANKVFSCGFYITMIIGICLFLSMILIKPLFFNGIKASEDVIGLASVYYDYYKFAMILNPISFYTAVLIYCDGDEILYGLSSFLQVIANIALSSLLGKKLGIVGLAIGTLISICICFSIAFLHFLKKNNTLKFVNYFKLADCITMFKYSFPTNIPMLGWSIMSAVFTRLIIKIKGPEYIVVITVFMCVLEISEIFKSVINAMPPLVLSYTKYKCAKGAEKIMKLSIIKLVYLAVAVNAGLLIFPRLILLMYNISNTELYPELIASVRIFSLMMLPMAIYSLFSAYYIAIDKMLYGLLINFSKDVVLPISIGVCAGELYGFVYMQWGIVVGVLLSGVIIFVCLYLINRKNGFPYMDKLIGHERCLFSEYLVDARNEGEIAYDIAGKLKDYHITEEKIRICNFLIESYLQKIYDINGCPVNVEFIIDLNDKISFIIRDDGIIANIIMDKRIDSFNDYVMYSFLEKYYQTRYYESLSCNCHVLQLVKE